MSRAFASSRSSSSSSSSIARAAAGAPLALVSAIATTVLAAAACAGHHPSPATTAEATTALRPKASALATPPPLPAPSTNPKLFGGRVIRVPAEHMPLVVVRIAFQAGSIDDPKGREGLTALTATLMAEGGTKSLTSAQLLEKLFPMAAAIDVQIDKELTVFSGTVHRDHVDRYVPLLIDAITKPRWDPNEFNRLRDDAVVDIQKRLRSGDDEDLGKEALSALMWAGHPYGHYTGGAVQPLEAATLEDCKAQAGRVFTRERMLIGVGGAADDHTVKMLETGLAALPAKGAPLVDLPAPTRAGPKMLLVEKDAQSTAISMGYPYALKRGDSDYYPMMVAGSALGEHRQFTGRLMRELRVKRGLNYGDFAYIEHFEQAGFSTLPAPNVARRQQEFAVWLRPVATENELFATRAAIYQLEQYRKGITPEEFETVKGFLSGYTLLWEQTPMRRLAYAIDDVFYGTNDFLGGFRKALDTMTVEDVNRVIPKWIDPAILKIAAVTRNAPELKQAVLTNAPSPIHYVAQAPEPEVVTTDQRFVSLPLDVNAQSLETLPASALFER